MSRFTKVKDASGVNALADLLNGNTRRLPVAVISIPAGRQSPWIDADEVAREVGNLADVYVIQTGKLTWELAARLPEGTQVFGGAGRVYPTGHQWSANLSSSPLRFAFNKSDGQTATKDLISDCLRMAAAAGLLQTQSTSNLTEVTAIVRNTIAGRGVVELPKRVLGSVAEELTVPDVRIERILQPGQQISGRYDARTGRVDITASLRSSSTALADYVVGDVVLTRVAMVRKRKAELVLYPKTDAEPVTVAVLQEEVTLNPFDDLRDLMTVGEVIPARVVATGPDWKLVLNDVDDEEEIVPAPSLLLGGPPWLVEEPIQPEAEEPEPLAPPLLQQQAPESPAPPEPTPTDSAEEQAPKPRPTPMVLDRNRPRATPPPTVAKEVDSAAKVPPNTR
ncbi:MAG TPA: hypothetical protein PKL71_05515, partial [Marmoricola sp.]|nr:hypothetical protein [Marmoricola sp.]